VRKCTAPAQKMRIQTTKTVRKQHKSSAGAVRAHQLRTQNAQCRAQNTCLCYLIEKRYYYIENYIKKQIYSGNLIKEKEVEIRCH